jgi:hypothetical protein
MALNTWHHVVGTFDGQTLNLYVDGQLRNSNTLPVPDFLAGNTADICIGEYPGLAEGFSGIIDSVTLLKRAKTGDEVFATYVGMACPCEGDLDGDRQVDGADLAILYDDYDRTGCLESGDCPGDINADGTVDNLDLRIFADDLGRENCWH